MAPEMQNELFLATQIPEQAGDVRPTRDPKSPAGHFKHELNPLKLE